MFSSLKYTEIIIDIDRKFKKKSDFNKRPGDTSVLYVN